MEDKLIEKSINGDMKSFELLIDRYMQYAYNIAYRMMGNEEDAKDMSQEAMIKAYRNIKKFERKSQFSTWLYRIVMNTCKDELRKRKEETLSMDELIGEGITRLDSLQDDTSNPVIAYEELEVREEIHQAIGALKEEYKAVVILKDMMGYSYEEIGQILQIPIGTVRSRLSRSRLQLRSALQDLLGQGKGGVQ